MLLLLRNRSAFKGTVQVSLGDVMMKVGLQTVTPELILIISEERCVFQNELHSRLFVN